jgi:hypothetical protein
MVSNQRYEVLASHDVAPAWAGQSADFALYTVGRDQYVAFYGADRSIQVGHRTLEETEWSIATVTADRNDPWDHHNSLALAVDSDGHLHLVGDLHVDPLCYFRTTEPRDVTTFERRDEMVGPREERATYPAFLRSPEGELVFKYRDGKSGAGDWLYNRYDLERREWKRLLEEPLTRGGEQANAYPEGPVRGPDGYYHLVWCWRDHFAAQTNHDLYYVRSRDLRHWETHDGQHVSTPIGLHMGDLVDPVAPYGGLLNSRIRLGFDTDDRVVVSYMKFDPDGNTQIYNARAESGGWECYRTSDWSERIAFGGGGSLGVPLRFDGVREGPGGRLFQAYEHPTYGSGLWILEEDTLEPVAWRSPWYRHPRAASALEAADERLRVNWVEDSGGGPEIPTFLLRYEALDPHHGGDGEPGRHPDATTLRCYRVRERSI